MHLHDIKMKEREQKIKEDVKSLVGITSKFSEILEEAIQNLKPEDIKASDIPRFLKTLLPLEWELRKFQLELEEKERQQRRSATEEMTFKVEVLWPDQIRERLKEERENGLV